MKIYSFFILWEFFGFRESVVAYFVFCFFGNYRKNFGTRIHFFPSQKQVQKVVNTKTSKL